MIRDAGAPCRAKTGRPSTAPYVASPTRRPSASLIESAIAQSPCRSNMATKKPSVAVRSRRQQQRLARTIGRSRHFAFQPRRPMRCNRRQLEFGMPGQEGGNLFAVLFRQDRARDVDQPAARLDHRCRRSEHRALFFQSLFDRLRLQPPFRIRPPPPRPRSRTRRIDEHEVEAPGEICKQRFIAGFHHLHVAHARPLQPLEDRPQLAARIMS